jgi:hypothetical protein
MYSGKKALLRQVAVPNLYFDLARQYQLLGITLEVPGRIREFDRDRDKGWNRFLAQCELPLTEEHIARFLRWWSRTIQAKYRTTATQSHSKPSLDNENAVLQHLRDAADARKSPTYGTALEAVGPLLHDYTVGAILYRDFRSSAIHEYGFAVGANFFDRDDLFFETVHFGLDNTTYLDLRFTATWLLDLLLDSMENYLHRLLTTKKLPPSLAASLIDPRDDSPLALESLDYFDDALLDEPRFLPISIGR